MIRCRSEYCELDKWMYEELDVAKAQAQELNACTAGPPPAAPSLWDSVTELPRVLLEMSALGYSWPLLGSAPRGDGHVVFVLPGFIAGDRSTLALRRFLDRQNYQSVSWGLGQNTGQLSQQQALADRFEALLAQTSGTISLVGQSLGGVYARMLATRWPDRVRQVITLGSPFASPGAGAVNPAVSRLFQSMSGMSADAMRDQMLDLVDELPVPSTAIYSRTDGVVHWTSCVDDAREQTENVEIVGSHSGMGFNPVVLYVIADRLSQLQGSWKPFQRSGCLKNLIYPPPVSNSRSA